MPKPTKGPRLGGSSSHQKALLANLATSLFEHGRIKTTEPKPGRCGHTQRSSSPTPRRARCTTGVR